MAFSYETRKVGHCQNRLIRLMVQSVMFNTSVASNLYDRFMASVCKYSSVDKTIQ